VVSSIGQYKSLRMNQQNINNILELREESKKDSSNILFLSVIYQALLDATKSKSITESSSITSIRREATNWFFASIGVTSENFEFICDYADLNPNKVREFASYVINSDNNKEVRHKLNLLLRRKELE